MAFCDDELVSATPYYSGIKCETFTNGRTKVTTTYRDEAPMGESKLTVFLELTGARIINDRPGVDVVALLDVSDEMQGDKLKHLKSAMRFLIDKLSAVDRLSIVAFSNEPKRLCPLEQITPNFRALVEGLVNDLETFPGKNIKAGLEMAFQVINDRRYTHDGRIPAVILISGGDQSPRARASIKVAVQRVPIYAFGLEQDHKLKVLQDIAEQSGGEFFSFGNVENTNSSSSLRDAFSHCLTNLLTIAADDLKLILKTLSSTAKIESVNAGSYPQTSTGPKDSVIVSFGNLYKKEMRMVKVELFLSGVDSEQSADVLKISFSYSVGGKKFECSPRPVSVSRIADRISEESSNESACADIFVQGQKKLEEMKGKVQGMSWSSSIKQTGDEELVGVSDQLVETASYRFRPADAAKTVLDTVKAGKSQLGSSFQPSKYLGGQSWFSGPSSEKKEEQDTVVNPLAEKQTVDDSVEPDLPTQKNDPKKGSMSYFRGYVEGATQNINKLTNFRAGNETLKQQKDMPSTELEKGQEEETEKEEKQQPDTSENTGYGFGSGFKPTKYIGKPSWFSGGKSEHDKPPEDQPKKTSGFSIGAMKLPSMQASNILDVPTTKATQAYNIVNQHIHSFSIADLNKQMKEEAKPIDTSFENCTHNFNQAVESVKCIHGILTGYVNHEIASHADKAEKRVQIRDLKQHMERVSNSIKAIDDIMLKAGEAQPPPTEKSGFGIGAIKATASSITTTIMDAKSKYSGATSSNEATDDGTIRNAKEQASSIIDVATKKATQVYNKVNDYICPYANTHLNKQVKLQAKPIDTSFENCTANFNQAFESVKSVQGILFSYVNQETALHANNAESSGLVRDLKEHMERVSSSVNAIDDILLKAQG